MEKKANTDLKIIESDIIMSPSEKSELKQNNDRLTITNHNRNLTEQKTRSSRSSSSSRKCAFALYQNGMSDWDSTDSESGINETNDNYGEPETCQTHF